MIVFGFLLAHSFSTFEGLRDSNYNDLPGLKDAVIADRQAMLLKDTLRSLALLLVTAITLRFFLRNKVKQKFVIAAIAVVVLFDLISVNKKYVNASDFKPSRKVEIPFIASNADKLILEDKTHFRVANFTTDPMQDGATSYFHQSIGGYHAAKMGRYQELFEYQIAKNNMEVLNMLNTKYFIVADANNENQVQQNPDINGNVWFVDNVVLVNSANEEMKALDALQTKTSAVLDQSKLSEKSDFKFEIDSTATIKLTKYDVTQLEYQSKSTKEQFAVFSEIYYKDGWNGYVDGKLTPHYRVNYVLRGMKIPAGNHKIEFKFEPIVIQQGGFMSLAAYIILLVAAAFGFLYGKKKKEKQA